MSVEYSDFLKSRWSRTPAIERELTCRPSLIGSRGWPEVGLAACARAVGGEFFPSQQTEPDCFWTRKWLEAMNKKPTVCFGEEPKK